MNNTQKTGKDPLWTNFAIAAAVLALVLGALFREALRPDMAIFANDGPIGATASLTEAGWQNLDGIWSPLYWLGTRQPGLSLCPSSFLLMALNPVGFAKFYAPASLMILGLGAWFFFRSLKAPNWVCVLGAVAVALNVSSFSTACWGLGSWVIAMGFIFLALATLQTERYIHPAIRYSLAGLGVGVAVMEGFDSGAIMSLYVAAFVVFQALIESGPRPVNFVKGAGKTLVVALFAGLIAAHTLGDLVQTQIQGIAGVAPDAESKKQRWDFATQWSLPKIETLRIVIPGLFGYRMTDDDRHYYEGSYWGTVGQQPGFEQHHQGYPRHSGSGEHAGVFVVLVAFWAIASSWRRKTNPFSEKERLMIRFWAVMAVVSVCFAWGRHAPFYQFLYQLPYFSTIRNPIKFMRPFQLAITILFVYGLLGLARQYLQGSTPAGSLGDQLKKWWVNAPAFDKKWTYATGMLLGVSVIGLLVYASAETDIEKFLKNTGFDPESAPAIAHFSQFEVVWFILFLSLSCVILTTIISGALAGSRIKLTIVVMSLLIAADLGRADRPWIVSYDYKDKYASNPVVDFLNEHKHEERVAVLMPIMPAGGPLENDRQILGQFVGYNHETWLQHHYPYLGIQTLDIPQEPRKSQDKMDYESALMVQPLRYWQLTNTRFIIGTLGVIDWLNQVLAGGKPAFKAGLPFKWTLKPSVTNFTGRAEQLTVEVSTNGPFALIEVQGALPRAKLFSNWQIQPDNKATLQQLGSPGFDPLRSVLVADSIPAPSAPDNPDPGSVSITDYKSRRVQLEAAPKVPCVLLLDDHFDPAWTATVDGKTEKILRCNSVVRGLYLTPGNHQIIFSFEPKTPGLYFTVAGWILGVLLAGFVFIFKPAWRTNPQQPAANPAPA